jgi:Uma2 family endonuclease
MSTEAKSKGKLGYREYVNFPQDGRRHEIIDGDHFANPAPETYHQTISRRIQFQLYTQIELNGLGQVFDAPTDVQLSERDIVQPDLIIILKENQTIITPTKVKGTPNLIVEILSKSTAETDRKLKKELYRKSGVAEYWIVDPEEHCVEQFVLRTGDYSLLGTHAERVQVQLMDNVTVDLAKVW